VKFIAALRRAVAAEDPRAAAANLVALVLAWNTPFYPLYALGAAGGGMHPGAWLTLAVLPAFLAVPAATRRWQLGGRVLLAAAGLGNTLWCTWLLGEASGTPLFLFACIVLAPVLFRHAERAPLLAFLILPLIAGVLLYRRYPSSPFACAAAECDALLWLNGVSVGCLLLFLGLLLSRLGEPPTDAVATTPPRRPRAP
jgi:hypothetical protein